MFKNYIISTLRNIKKNKGISSLNIFGLAIGMACCILILLWVQDELSFDSFHKNADNLYRIKVDVEQRTWRSSSWALINTLKKNFPEVEMGSWYMRRSANTRYKKKKFIEQIALVAPDFLKMFSFPKIKGDFNTTLSNKNSVILTEDTARKYFDNEDPIGKTINIQNRIDLTVTGVIKNVPANSHMQFNMLAHPEVFITKERMQTWSMDCPSYISLTNGADYKKVEKKIRNVIIENLKNSKTKFYVGLQPLNEIHLRALNGTNPVIYVYIFSVIALLILIIACINFMNLSTARSMLRANEIGMRKVLGGKRSNIIKQFFSESIIFSFLSLIIAVFLVYFFLPTFNAIAMKQISITIIGDFKILSGLILITLLAGIISGIYPALYLSSFKPLSIIKNFKNKGGKGFNLRHGLIIFQFTAAAILIIFTSVILKQINFIRDKDLGLDRENVLTIRMDKKLTGKYKTLKEELLRNKEIMNVSAASNLPLATNNNNPVYWEGLTKKQAKMYNFVLADYDYFKTFNMKIKYGRSFSPKIASDKKNFIINESLLKETGYKDPIGEMLTVDNKGSIIGVVKDFHGTNLQNKIRPTVFYMNADYMQKNILYIKVKSSNIPSTINYIKDSIKNLYPGFFFRYRFMDDIFNNMYNRESLLQKLLTYFTFLAIFISGLGLLGLASFLAMQKTKEIAIRKVLGATTRSIMGKISREFIHLVVIANLIAWPAAYYLINGWLKGYAYRTSIGLEIFFLSAIITIFIALIPVSHQAYKASNANPIDSLRKE